MMVHEIGRAGDNSHRGLRRAPRQFLDATADLTLVHSTSSVRPSFGPGQAFGRRETVRVILLPLAARAGTRAAGRDQVAAVRRSNRQF
jgi:hypothetical protein